MKILCPVDSPEEAASLAALGAGELYGGLTDEEWQRRFTLAASANRRSFPEAQIRGGRALRETVEAAHRGGAIFSLTLNSPFYTAPQMDLLLKLTERALADGVDALIVSDIGLILELRKRWPETPLHLSTMAEVANPGAAAFYEDLGVKRIALPRHLPLSSIREIAEACPAVGLDVFILYGQCPNAEGYCTFPHDHPRRRWPCIQDYSIGGGGSGKGEAAARHQRAWIGLHRGEACGLCALLELKKIGIAGLKIVGRGTGSPRKEWAVATTAALLGFLEDDEVAADAFRAEARRLYRERFSRSCHPTLCYFPELMVPSDD